MESTKNTDQKSKQDIKTLQLVLKEGKFYFYSIVIPIFLSVGAGLFESFGIGLLIPLFKGILESDFSFLGNLPLVGNFFQKYFLADNYSKKTIFFVLIALIFIFTILRHGMVYCSRMITEKNIQLFVSNIQSKLLGRCLLFGKYFFDRNSIGNLYSVIVIMTRNFSHGIRQFNVAILAISMMVFYLFLMFIISWQLTLFCIAVFTVVHFSVNWLMAKTRRLSDEEAQKSIVQSKKMADILSSVPLIKAYNQEKVESEKFSHVSQNAAKMIYFMNKKEALVSPIQEIVGLAGMLLLVCFVAYLTIKTDHPIEFASFLVFFYLARRLMQSIGQLNSARIVITQRLGYSSIISQLLQDDDKYYVQEGEKYFEGLKSCITFNNLNFYYQKDRNVLKDIKFEIKKGSTVAIVGHTGSGKSTLVHLLMRYYDCQENQIFLDDTDIRKYTLASIRNHIAFVGQDPILFHDTIRANLLYGINGDIDQRQIDETLKKSGLYDFIQTLPKGLETEIGDRGVQLSGGERQRLSIARAILKQVDIVILDEATSALDSKTEKLIQNSIYNVLKDKTVIMIAHRLSTIKEADQILVMNEGVLVESGTFDELVNKKKIFYELWKTQKIH